MSVVSTSTTGREAQLRCLQFLKQTHQSQTQQPALSQKHNKVVNGQLCSLFGNESEY